MTDEQKQKYIEAIKNHKKEYKKNMTDEKNKNKKIIKKNIEKT